MRPGPGQSGARSGAYSLQSRHPMRLIALAALLGLAACTGKPSLDDPALSDRDFELEQFFDGRLVAHGQF